MYIYTANREPNNDQSTICETTTSGDCTCRTGGFNPTLKPRSTHRFDYLFFLYRNGAFTFNFFLNNLFFFWKDKIWEKNDNLRGLRIDVGKQIFPPINHMPSKSLNVMSTNFGSRAEIALECNNKSTWCASILEPMARRPGYRSKRNHFLTDTSGFVQPPNVQSDLCVRVTSG